MHTIPTRSETHAILRQWRKSTPWIEVAPKYSVSSEAQAEWFQDSIPDSKLNHKLILQVLHYWRNTFAQPLSKWWTYGIVWLRKKFEGAYCYYISLPVFLYGRSSPDWWVHPSQASINVIQPDWVTERVQSQGLVITAPKWSFGDCRCVGGFFAIR